MNEQHVTLGSMISQNQLSDADAFLREYIGALQAHPDTATRLTEIIEIDFSEHTSAYLELLLLLKNAQEMAPQLSSPLLRQFMQFGLPTLVSATALTSLRSASPSSPLVPSSLSLRAMRSNLKVSIEGITKAMELDKKKTGRTIRWVLLEDIGRAVVRSGVPQEEVLAVLHELAES